MFTTICNLVAGITLFFFSILYIYYIVYTLSQLNNRTRSIGMQSEDAKYIKKWVRLSHYVPQLLIPIPIEYVPGG